MDRVEDCGKDFEVFMDYADIAKQSRIKCLELVYKAQTSHIGSLFSCADIMAVLFEKMDLEKDIFVAGKSWCAALLYYHLWRKGKITEEQLDSYCQDGSLFIGLVEPVVPKYIPFGIGSMGYGVAAGVGFALAKKRKGEDGTVYVLLSDGELNCGSTWESAAIAAQHKLDNLVVLVDRNQFQAMGRTEDILQMEPIGDKWEAFGWGRMFCDGHDFVEIDTGIHPIRVDYPNVTVFNTIKGKGWKRAENNNLYHYKQLSEDEYVEAHNELQS